MKNLFASLFIVLSLIPAYPQDTIHVPGDYSTIQAGINAASNGDLVLVEDSTYTENINYRGKAITVASWYLVDGDTNHINNTIIDGSQPAYPDSGSVVTFSSGEDTTSVLCGFTITGGSGTYISGSQPVRVGGGINCLMSGAKIINCHIENNSIYFRTGTVVGGGISVGPPGNTSWLIALNNIIRNNLIFGNNGEGGGICVVGNARLENNLVEYNTAESVGSSMWGGGIALFTINVVTSYEWFVKHNTIRYNKSIAPSGTGGDGGIGGGMAVAGTSRSVIIKNNKIIYNEVQSNAPIDCHGGGVILQNQTETCIFSENLVANNKALQNSFCKGAGISIWSYNTITQPILYNNIITNNTNGNLGGGIFIGGTGNFTNSPVILHNTLTNNSAVFGGAIYSDQSSPRIINSILWNNGTEIYYSGGNVEVHYSDIEGGWTGTGNNNINADPYFTDPLYNLADSSLCIGAGTDSLFVVGTWLPFDFDGDPRPSPPGSRPDMGAQESLLGCPATIICINPTELYFHDVLLNNDSTMVFTITNTGSADLIVTDIFCTNPAFTVNITDTLITSGTDQIVEVIFTPTTASPYYGTIEITSNAVGSPDSVTVNGNGVTGIENELFNTFPDDFVLQQNYPNPFNPITIITYGLPEANKVELTLFNALGKEVAILSEGHRDAGYHQVEFNAAELPSGVYFYQLRAGDFVKTKKMILMK